MKALRAGQLYEVDFFARTRFQARDLRKARRPLMRELRF
jgi:hypothetical protein